MGLPLRLMRRLQLVQNGAARLITGVKKFQHISLTLANLHWLLVCFLINFKVMMITFKALNGLGPPYLSECLLPARSVRNTCSSQAGRLRALIPKEAQRERKRNWTFSAVTPCLWNNLPIEIRLAPLLDGFKTALKTWLFHQAFPEH